MRSRLFGVAVAALVGAGLAVAQQPAPAPVVPMPVAPPVGYAAPPAGMVPVPVAPPVGYTPVPVVVQGQPGCASTAPAALAAPTAGGCGDCGGGAKAKTTVFGRLLGTSMPVGCSCLAAERNFAFGSCRNFYTPGKTCFGGVKEYGCGSGECGYGPNDPCRHITSFHNR